MSSGEPFPPLLRRAPAFAAMACAMLLALGLAPAPVRAQDAIRPESFLPLRGQKRVLVETRDGRLIQAEPVGVFRDSLLLDRHLARFRTLHLAIACSDVERAWVKRSDARRGALVYGVTGLVGGALIELGLGSSRRGLGFDAEKVLGGGLGSGVSDVPLGALIGWLWPTWRQVVPSDGAHAGGEPFPAWSVTALGGVGRASSSLGTGTQIDGAIAAWKNTGRNGSWGFESGTLSRATRQVSSPGYRDTLFGSSYYVDALDATLQERWAYWTLQFRRRFGRSGVRPLFTFGLGDYVVGGPFDVVRTDSLGNQWRSHGRDVGDRLGANAGLGVTWGRGPAHPDVELRVHDAFRRGELVWVTLQAGILYE